jgi:hypothetical protein
MLRELGVSAEERLQLEDVAGDLIHSTHTTM